MIKYLEEHKQEGKVDKKEKKKLVKFLKKKDVKQVFDEYEGVLKYLFKYYCVLEDHELGLAYHEDITTMDHREVFRFGYQS